jgi:hypothetical protein
MQLIPLHIPHVGDRPDERRLSRLLRDATASA